MGLFSRGLKHMGLEGAALGGLGGMIAPELLDPGRSHEDQWATAVAAAGIGGLKGKAVQTLIRNQIRKSLRFEADMLINRGRMPPAKLADELKRIRGGARKWGVDDLADDLIFQEAEARYPRR